MVLKTEFKVYDTIIIGGGQAGLSVAYFMKRTKLDYVIIDNQSKSGGAWLHTWDSLRLFSPSMYSSLSGWQMPASQNEYPTKNEFISYLSEYEKRYAFPVIRNTNVLQVSNQKGVFELATNNGKYYCKSLVSATGTAMNPYIPSYPNCHKFKGRQIHSVAYRNTDTLKNKKVLVIGAGNSGAQILAEVSKVATTKWVASEPPVFLPEEIDGRYLFIQATDRYLKRESQKYPKEISLRNIVQVKSVKEGIRSGVYKDYRPFKEFYEHGVVWSDNSKEAFDVVLWCTGFRPNLKHLQKLGITKDNTIKTQNTHAIKEPRLWLVGYGNWTGFASATIYGVGKTAKQTVEEIAIYFHNKSSQNVV